LTSIWLVRTVFVARSRRPFHWTFMPTFTNPSITWRSPSGVLTMIVVDAFQMSFFVPTMR
jgi:hypothetical protein